MDAFIFYINININKIKLYNVFLISMWYNNKGLLKRRTKK